MDNFQEQLKLLIQLYKTKKYEHAKKLAATLTKQKPHDPVAWKIRGALYKHTKNTGEALFCFKKVIAISPYDAEAYFNLGASFNDRGDTESARISYEKALELKSDFSEAHNNLGNLSKSTGDLEGAIQCFKKAIEINPNLVQAYNNLGNAFRDAGQLFEAKRSLEEAILKSPNFPEAHNNLGNTFRDLGYIENAKVCYERALKLRPRYSEAVGNMGVLLKLLGQHNEAVAWNRRALTLTPSTENYNNLGNSLAQIGEINEAEKCYRKAIEISPDSFVSHSNLLFLISAYKFDIQTYQAQCTEYGRLVEQKVTSKYTTWKCTNEPKKFRIGLVSADLRSHPVGYFLEGVLGKINPSSFEIVTYSNEDFEDELTNRLRLIAHHWRSIYGLTDEKAAKLIHEDGIHILIDLSGHTVKNRLPIFGWRPAPIQVTWLGYFASTGVREIDYIIGDSDVTPIQESGLYSEKIYQLPDSYLCFSPPPFEIEIGELPALKNGIVTFGCVSNISRLTKNVIEIWGEILKRLPSACLLIKDKRLTQSRERQNLSLRFDKVGIGESRLIMEGDSSRAEYLEAFNRIDIVLAPFPYGGGTTTAEALWMGTPVMTFFGTSFLSRLGGSLMNTAGLEHWIACNEEEYIDKAVSFASDLVKLSLLRKELRGKVLASPLFDATLFARNLEVALLEIWELNIGQ